MGDENPVCQWYALCRAYLASPRRSRKSVTRQTLATYRRIRELPAELGQGLDRRGAPLRVVRWVAWAETDEVRRERYLLAVGYHERAGRWPKPGDAGTPGEVSRAMSAPRSDPQPASVR
jgi:hypothetical protein